MTVSTDYETQAVLVHSHGPDNKNPDYDLGGQPSKFAITETPKNNLFDDVLPQDIGLIDWRCIYLTNNQQNTVVKDINFTISNVLSCTSICVGTRLANDIQMLTFDGPAETNGTVILATEFGGPFTCIFGGNWTTFATEIENKIRLTRWCDQVTVTLYAILAGGGAKYLVEFTGTTRNRLVQPITVVQNDLVSIRGPEYRISNYAFSDPFNRVGTNQIKVVWLIDTDIPIPGTVTVFNPNNGGQFATLNYTSIAGYIFNLNAPLMFALVPGDELWVNNISQISCIVDVTKYQDGYPIGQYAEILNFKTDLPSVTSCTEVLDVGMLLPKESCYLWLKRTTENCGCKTGFTLQATGTDEQFMPPEPIIIE